MLWASNNKEKHVKCEDSNGQAKGNWACTVTFQ